MSVPYGDGSRRRVPHPARYRVIIPERFEHTEVHSRLKRLVAKDGGVVVVDRGSRGRTWTTEDLPEGD